MQFFCGSQRWCTGWVGVEPIPPSKQYITFNGFFSFSGGGFYKHIKLRSSWPPGNPDSPPSKAPMMVPPWLQYSSSKKRPTRTPHIYIKYFLYHGSTLLFSDLPPGNFRPKFCEHLGLAKVSYHQSYAYDRLNWVEKRTRTPSFLWYERKSWWKKRKQLEREVMCRLN